MDQIKNGDIVTIESGDTYIVDRDEGDTVLLSHPLYNRTLIRVDKATLNVSGAKLKDSAERSLDFARQNLKFLDYNTTADLEALCLYYVVTRKLTPRQKSILSNICGTIASIILNNEIKDAMKLVQQNEGLLDEFNAMWYRNFNGLFTGRQAITSKKQRSAIFNIAGFVLAELKTPTVQK